MALRFQPIWVALLGAVIYFLIFRWTVLWTMWANHPSRLVTVSNIDYEIKFQDNIRNCEDAVLDEKNGVAILSCDPGRDVWNTVMGVFIDPNVESGGLFTYTYSDPTAVPTRLELKKLPKTFPQAIHALGIGFNPPTRDLYVTSVAHPPSLFVFKLSSDGKSATYQRTVAHPLIQTPNSVTAVSDHGIYITNDHRFKRAENPWLAQIETYSGYKGGSVIYYDLATDEAKKVANVHFANGVAPVPGHKLAVASTSSPSILFFDVDPATYDLRLNFTVPVNFLVDNLKTDSNGVLLIAGHPHSISLERVAKQNHQYDVDQTGKAGLRPESERPRAPSWVSEWSWWGPDERTIPDWQEDWPWWGNKTHIWSDIAGQAKQRLGFNGTGSLRDLYVGMDYGCSTTAVRDVKRGIGLVVGLYERGLMVWKNKEQK